MKVEFLNRLTVNELPHCNWQLINPFYSLVTLDDGYQVEVIIPEYFVTDFASTPRLPFTYLLFGGIGNRAGVLHDALYSPWTAISCRYTHGEREVFETTRPWADEVLLAALLACGISSFKSNCMYAAVRAFGWRFYKKPPLNPQGVFSDEPY